MSKMKKRASLLTTASFLFVPHRKKNCLEEGIGSLGGEAGFVLTAQDPVGQWELDLGVLQGDKRAAGSESSSDDDQLITLNILSPVSKPPGDQTGADTWKRNLAFSMAGF